MFRFKVTLKLFRHKSYYAGIIKVKPAVEVCQLRVLRDNSTGVTLRLESLDVASAKVIYLLHPALVTLAIVAIISISVSIVIIISKG